MPSPSQRSISTYAYSDAELEDLRKGASILLPLFKAVQELTNDPNAVRTLERLATMKLPTTDTTVFTTSGKQYLIHFVSCLRTEIIFYLDDNKELETDGFSNAKSNNSQFTINGQ